MKKQICKRITASILCMLMLALTVPCIASAETAKTVWNETFEGYTADNPFVLENGNQDASYQNKTYWYRVGDLSANDSISVVSYEGSNVLKFTNNTKAADGETADNTTLPKVYFRMPSKITGVVEVSYQLKVDTEDNKLSWGNNFFAALCENGALEGARIGKHETGLFIPIYSVTNTTPAFDNTYADGEWHYFKIILDYNNMKYTVTVDQTTSAEYMLAKEDVRTLEFRYGDSSDFTVYMDDLKVEQKSFAAPKLSSSSVSNGATGVSAAGGSITFNFSDAMDLTTAQNIKLYKGSESGTLVTGTTVSVSENIVTLSYPKLDNSTLYTVVIPGTVKSANDVAFAGEVISFVTKSAGLDVNIDFENISVDTTGLNSVQKIGALNEAISKKYGITSSFSNNWQQIRYDDPDAETMGGYNASHSKWNDVNLNGKASISVENGRLKLFRSKDYTQAGVYYALFVDPNYMGDATQKIEDGIVNLSFDLEYETKPKSSQFIQFNQDSFKIYLAHGSTTSVYQVGSWGSGGDVSLWKDYTNVKTHFDLKFDLTGDTGTVTTAVDGYATPKTVNLTNKLFDRVLFYIDQNTSNDVTYYLDNIKISQIAQPTVDVSVADGAADVSTVDNIGLTFNALMKEDDIKNITVKDSGGSSAVFSLVSDFTGYKYSMRFHEPLKTSTAYTITIPELTSKDGLKTAAKTITFTTAASKPDLYISSYAVTGADALEANGTVKVEAVFNNSSDAALNAWLGIALYSASDELLKIGYNDAEVVNGTPQTVEASFTVPADIADGAYIKIFAWNGADLLKPIRTVITD